MEKLTKKEKGFADDYLESGNGTKAVLQNYDTDSENSAASIATQNLRKVKIQEYLESKSERASIRIVELSEQAENLPVALGATKDILDRSGFKPVEKSINLNVEAEITNPKARQLAEKYEEELKKSL